MKMNKLKCINKAACLIAMTILMVVAFINYLITEDIFVEKSEEIGKENDANSMSNSQNGKNANRPASPYRIGKLHLSLGKRMNFQLKSLSDDYEIKLRGEIGMGIPDDFGRPTFCKDSLHCLSWKAKIKLMIKRINSRCYVFIWKSHAEEPLMDCFSFGEDYWYGGPENSNQYWPVEELDLQAQPYLSQENQFMSISERYWLTSSGVYIYIDEGAPLFIDTNYYRQNSICFIAKDSPPYLPRENTRFKYTVCQFDDPRTAHEHALKNVLKTPSDIPDTKMVQYPIWSTWVKFQQDVKDKDVINFANNITMHGFNHSQIEIDDNWETCYGSKEFNPIRFKNVTDLITKLKRMQFRVTLWTHPFVNTHCKIYKNLAKKGYFAKSHRGSTKITWWNGEASVIDFTNNEAREWFKQTHFNLMNKTGIDGFKFDAGETSWLPQVCILNSTYNKQPHVYTRTFAETAAEFGKISEIRVGQKTQHLPLFVRMLDKDSRWTFDNGLPTLITTLLVMNIVGYNWVLPDMVGGNGYMTNISKELFIRWLQANTFMPTIQFSAAPFDYDNETIEISKKFTSLHYSYSDKIVDLMRRTVKTGAPLNPPIWWVDPKNPTALAINSEYLLGEDILVAPVIEEDAVQRDVYLPQGIWQDGNNPEAVYKGRHWLRNYPADITKLPYFIRMNNTNKRIKFTDIFGYDDNYEDKETYFGLHK